MQKASQAILITQGYFDSNKMEYTYIDNAVSETKAIILNVCLSPLLGYYGEGLNAIIVFAACYLPDSSCEDYTYIMENLFL